MPDLDAAMKRLNHVVNRKAKTTATATAETKPEQQVPVNLPRCDAQYRMVVNVCVRSALFPALNRQERRKIDDKIWSASGITLHYSGEQLDQSDLTVYLELIHAMDKSGRLETTKHSILKALGKTTGSDVYRWLDGCIRRLKKADITIETEGTQKKKGYRYLGGLIHSVKEDLESGEMQFSLDPNFARLFTDDGYTIIDIAQRRALSSPTAQCLHAWLSSHRPPWSYSLDTLASVAGITGKNRRTAIRRALDQLVGIGHVSAWTEDAGVVNIAPCACG